MQNQSLRKGGLVVALAVWSQMLVPGISQGDEISQVTQRVDHAVYRFMMR